MRRVTGLLDRTLAALARDARTAGRARRRRGGTHERGAALVTSLLCMTLLYALGLSLLLSTTTDTLMSNSYRASQEAFFAADAGLAIGRRSLARAISEKITAVASGQIKPYNANAQILPDSESAPNAPFFSAVKQRAVEIANDDARSTFENDSRYKIEVVSLEGGPTTSPVRNPHNGLESYTYTYVIKSTGRSSRGAHAEVTERGELQTSLTAAVTVSRFPFSAYGTFFDQGDPGRGLVLVSGTFTGKVHTNTHFTFSSQNNVIFRGQVTQSDPSIIYDGSEQPIPGSGMQGVAVGEGKFKQAPRVPLPKNNYSQELAVVNGSGDPGDTEVDANGRVTPDALKNGLTDAQGRQPEISGNGIAPGVYVGSSDGSTVTGGGIYVNGDADVSLSTSGDTQTINVTTNGQRSTVTIDYGNNTTTLTTGGTSRTFTGVPTDTSFGPGQAKPGTSLFVNGSVTSLSGPPAVDGSTAPAIGPKTALTITAQRSIRITGDIKYSEPVVGPDGAPVPRANQNDSVLGVYTNDGNVELAPDPSLTDGDGMSLEVDGAIAAFNANTANDGGKTEGSIVFTGAHLPAGARLRIVGARIQSNIANIKYRNRQVYFDPRLDNGNFAPPFFPGVDTGKPSSSLEINFQGEESVVILADGWQRDERRKKKSAD